MASIRSFEYKIIKKFFTKEELAILQPYCDNQLSSFTQFPNDPQSFSPAWYNDELMNTMLGNKESLISKYSGLDVVRTYAYWRYYVYGAYLDSHMDRPACEISLTACIKKHDDWPITMNGTDYELEEGDGVIYLGCVLPHSRPGIYKGEGMAQVFMHYVDKNGPFTHHAYDNFNKKAGYLCQASDQDNEIIKQERKKYA